MADRGNPNWKPGVSGNPGGGPKGLARLIRERTGMQGERLYELIRQIMEGDVAFTPAQKRAVERLVKLEGQKSPRAAELCLLIEKLNMPSLKERLDAAKVLLEHGHGKPKEFVELTGAEGGPVELAAMDISRLSLADRIAWRDLVRKAGGAHTSATESEAEWVEVVPTETALVKK